MNPLRVLFTRAVLLVAATAVVSWYPALVTAVGEGSLPSYCAANIAESNVIPSLNLSLLAANFSLDDAELQQVIVLTRHGARTPWSSKACWHGLPNEPWDCSVTQVEIPSLTAAPGKWLFRKQFDAYTEDNYLGGTCRLGQLILPGYEQQAANGMHLRKAYVCEDSTCLFPSHRLEDIGVEALYLRSDDDERVVMSGQVLTASMFEVDTETILPWHTGDRVRDWIEPNKYTCPRVAELNKLAAASDEWIRKVHEDEATAKLNQSIASAWNLQPEEVDWDMTLDCVMCALCNGRETYVSQQVIDDAVDFSTWTLNYPYFYRDRELVKLAMGPLIALIRWKISELFYGSPEKFVLIAGHDTTLMPLLAAIAGDKWDRQWTPYASLITMEIIRIGEEFYFRTVYNGQVLQQDGCETDICPLSTFFDTTAFAEHPESCGETHEGLSEGHTTTTTEAVPPTESTGNSNLLVSTGVCFAGGIVLGIGQFFGTKAALSSSRKS